MSHRDTRKVAEIRHLLSTVQTKQRGITLKVKGERQHGTAKET
jgi:hypothetical protein